MYFTTLVLNPCYKILLPIFVRAQEFHDGGKRWAIIGFTYVNLIFFLFLKLYTTHRVGIPKLFKYLIFRFQVMLYMNGGKFEAIVNAWLLEMLNSTKRKRHWYFMKSLRYIFQFQIILRSRLGEKISLVLNVKGILQQNYRMVYKFKNPKLR